MCLNNVTWSLHRLACNVQNSVKVVKSSFYHIVSAAHVDRYIKWNYNNHSCAILNVDGSCHGSPARTEFRGILRNSGHFLFAFSGFIIGLSYIMLVELYVIFPMMIMSKDFGFLSVLISSMVMLRSIMSMQFSSKT